MLSLLWHATPLKKQEWNANKILARTIFHTEPIFKRIRLLKVGDLNVLQTAMFMFKLKQNLLPPFLIQCSLTIGKFIHTTQETAKTSTLQTHEHLCHLLR